MTVSFFMKSDLPQNSCSTWLFVVQAMLEKGNGSMQIEGEVLARKDVFRVMSVCGGKVCNFFFFGNILEGLFASGGLGCACETINRY